MKHINDVYVNALIRTFYNNYINSCPEDSGITFEEYKSIFDMKFVDRCKELANDVLKHPGKYQAAKVINKHKSFMKKKQWAMIVAALLIKGGDE